MVSMATYGYQNKDKDEKSIAYARVDGVDASYRDLCNVCSNVRGRRTDAAITFLSNALEEKKPIRTPRHNKRRGHVRSLGGKKGGWPQKSIKIVLGVLKNAQANALSRGLGDSKIVHIAANKQAVFGRIASKGRRQRSDYETAFVEVVVRELQSEQNMIKKKKLADEKKAKEQAKKKAEEKKEAEAKEKKEDVGAKKEVKAEKKSQTAQEKKTDETQKQKVKPQQKIEQKREPEKKEENSAEKKPVQEKSEEPLAKKTEEKKENKPEKQEAGEKE
jgi:ribosomal protein uL22